MYTSMGARMWSSGVEDTAEFKLYPFDLEISFCPKVYLWSLALGQSIRKLLFIQYTGDG